MTILDAHGLKSGKKDMMYCVIARLDIVVYTGYVG